MVTDADLAFTVHLDLCDVTMDWSTSTKFVIDSEGLARVHGREKWLAVNEAVGGTKADVVPETGPSVQLELEPVKAKLTSVPFLLLPLASDSVVSALLLALTKPWFA